MDRRLFYPAAAGTLALLCLWASVSTVLEPEVYDLGHTLHLLPRGFTRFVALYMLLGTMAAGAFTVVVTRAFGASARARWVEMWTASSDRRWLIYGSLLAAALPALIRTYVLNGLPIVDDESVYRFMARVLASGRVSVPSPPMKLFFDNRFLINDGSLYGQYFLGWPALLAPGVMVGLAGFWNSLISALTVLPLYRSVQALAGSTWAKASLCFYLTSPMLLFLAATELSHTSCIAALAWTTWAVLRIVRVGKAGLLWHVGAAAAFSIAFSIRPLPALGIGVPWLVVWLFHVVKRREPRALAAFAATAMVFAGLFLGANLAQNGDVTEVAYNRYLEYSRSNDFRFSLWPEEPTDHVKEMAWISPERSLAVAAAGFFRLNLALFGWPCSLFLCCFAAPGVWRRTLWWSFGLFFAAHIAVTNVGVDAFAPMHYIEAAWPVLLLTPLGLARLTTWARELRPQWAPVPVALVLSLTAVSWLGYVPVRHAAIERMMANIEQPFSAVEEAGIERGVIFVPEVFIPFCKHPPTGGWLFTRPNNRPDLADNILWVNHLSVELDRELARGLRRPGYILGWAEGCRPRLLALDEIPEGMRVPPASVNGLEQVLPVSAEHWDRYLETVR